MTCTKCVLAVERTLTSKVPDVISANVNFGTETASVEYDPQATSLEAMAEAVHNAGYELVLPAASAQDAGQDAELGSPPARASRPAALLLDGRGLHLLPLFVLSMSRDFGLLGDWKNLKSGSANMDVLVAMGSSVAYAYPWRCSWCPAWGITCISRPAP